MFIILKLFLLMPIILKLFIWYLLFSNYSGNNLPRPTVCVCVCVCVSVSVYSSSRSLKAKAIEIATASYPISG